MRLGKHDVFRFGVLHPAIARLDVHRTHFPAPLFVINAFLETLLLLIIVDGEPVFQQQNSVLHQHLLKPGAGHIELLDLFVGCKTHDLFHPGPVVPAAIEDDDFSSTGEVLDVALEIPLAFLML